MQTNIELVYDVLTAWFSKFNGIRNIWIRFGELGMEVGADWILGDKTGQYRYLISRDIMENAEAEFFPLCEKSLMEKIERAHSFWEVGEE